jgi:TPR repeat protein
MIDAVELYGLEALDDPFREEFERARALLDGPEWERGLDELEALAHAGSMLSTICVAGCMTKNWYDHKDLAGAEAWYRVAAEAGYSAGHFGLGVTYLQRGRFSEALVEFQEAAASNYRPAYNALAYLYSRGEGVALDRRKALALWRKGASQGHQRAKFALAGALLHGYGGVRGRFEGLAHLFRLMAEAFRKPDAEAGAETRIRPLPTVH